MNKDICISDIINNAKKDFKKDKVSVIKEYLLKNDKSVVTSTINKKRGVSVKIYYLINGVKKCSDYVPKNAKIVLDALKASGYTITDIKGIK